MLQRQTKPMAIHRCACATTLYGIVGEAGVKKVSKAVDSAVGSIGAIMVDHLQPTLQAAAFKLNELHSLAKCRRHFEPLGLQVRHRCFQSSFALCAYALLLLPGKSAMTGL